MPEVIKCYVTVFTQIILDLLGERNAKSES